MSDYELLLQPGLIGNYQSCRLTLVNLHHKDSGLNTLLYARFCMKAEASSIKDHNMLVSGKADDDRSLGVFEYDLSLAEVTDIYQKLESGGLWDSFRGHPLTTEAGMRMMGRKYTGPYTNHRENVFLKQTSAGSHWIEFFSETKKTVQYIYKPYEIGLLQAISPIIKAACNIDLDVAVDRIGNIIFQFPVTL